MKVDTVSAAQERAQRREPAHGDQVTFRGDKCDRSRGEKFYFLVQLLLHEKRIAGSGENVEGGHTGRLCRSD